MNWEIKNKISPSDTGILKKTMNHERNKMSKMPNKF